MNIGFFSAAALVLILIQTVVLPGTRFFPYCFDLLIILVAYLSLYFTRYSTIVAIAVVGILMDGLSGVPFFFHTFSYLWVYIFVQLFRQVVFHRSIFFIMTISVVAVLVEEGLSLFTVFLLRGEGGILAVDYFLLGAQLVLGIVLIPLGVWILDLFKQNAEYVIRRLRRGLIRWYRG